MEAVAIRRIAYILAWLGVPAAVGRGAEPAMKLADPAPPEVRPLATSAPAGGARPHPRVKVMSRPGPLPDGAVTSDWPNFLGPTHDGVSRETKLLKDFSTAPGQPARPVLVWQMAKGSGYTAPAVAGERLVAFHRIGREEIVECLHAERGTLYWEFRCPTTYTDRYNYNNGPRATPAIADGRVFAYGAEGRLHCLDLRTGHLYWKRDLAAEFDMRPSFFGAGASPLVEGGLVVLNIGGRRGPSVVAFDARTGRLVWGAETKWGAGYASPVPATIHGRRVLFVFAGGWSEPPTGGLLCLDPASGATHFRFPFRSRRVESVNGSSPVVVGDTVFISSIYVPGGALLRMGGDLTGALVYRTTDYSAHWMTPIVRGGYLYGFVDAKLVCMDLATGKEVWSARPQPQPQRPADAQDADGPPPGGRLGRASLLWADDAFLCLGEYGDLCWLNLSPKGMKITAAAKLFHAPQTWTAPVVSRGLLYVCQNYRDDRTADPPRILCYDLRRPPDR